MPDSERANNQIRLDLMPRGNGNTPVVIQVLSDEENFNRLKIILEDAGDRNIAILFYHQSEVDLYFNKVRELGFSCTKHHNRAQAGSNIENILITTYKSVKGLEFQVVIMPDMHTAMDKEEKTAEHYYIGCTRAKESLYLTFTGTTFPDYFEEFEADSYEFRPTEIGAPRTAYQNIDDLPF
jgi:DNA helicase IV